METILKMKTVYKPAQEEVAAYRTRDGKVYESIAEASDHEAKLDVYDAFRALSYCNFMDVDMCYIETQDDFKVLLENFASSACKVRSEFHNSEMELLEAWHPQWVAYNYDSEDDYGPAVLCLYSFEKALKKVQALTPKE